MNKIGKHKVTNLSIEDSGVEAMFRGEPLVDVLYVDPPWGDGNMKYWVTLRGKQARGAPPLQPLSYSALISRILFLNRTYCRGPLIIQTGVQWHEQLKDSMMDEGMVGVRAIPRLYRSGSKLLPCYYVVGSVPGAPQVTFTPTDRMAGPSAVVDMVRGVVGQGGILLDPCCGMGNSAKGAVQLGLRFFGNEFNPSRLQKTIDFLSKHP